MKIPRPRTLVPALAIALAALLPASASALEFEIVNESGLPPSDVFVTVTGGSFDVPGMTEGKSKALEEITDQTLQIETLDAGRIYVSYGAEIKPSELPFRSTTTRFDWVELNVHPSPEDKINLTAIEQFGIGMRIDTYGPGEAHLEALSSANSDTVFAALQEIPGGPQATVRNSQGEIVRVLSPSYLPTAFPALAGVYPPLTEYVQSMAGKAVTLHTAFFGSPFTTSVYSGTFGADGSILLSGTTNPAGGPPTISVSGPQLIADIYPGGNTPNTLEGTIYRDLLVGFVTGLWGGKYGNDAISWCTNPLSNSEGLFCPEGFNQPVFGDARASLEPYPACELYAATIAEHSDAYGHPYSDVFDHPQIPIVETGGGVAVEKAKLTILADSGNAEPVSGGSANCGAAPAPPANPAGPAKAKVKVNFLAKAKLKGRTAKVARLTCSVSCGQVKVVAKQGKKVIARSKSRMAKVSGPVKVRLTGKGRKAMQSRDELGVKVTVWVTPTGQSPSRSTHSVKLAK